MSTLMTQRTLRWLNASKVCSEIGEHHIVISANTSGMPGLKVLLSPEAIVLLNKQSRDWEERSEASP